MTLRPLLAFTLASALPSIATADPIDDLAPGTWYEIPDTPMRAVCPPDVEGFAWSYFCAGVITAWGGATLDTTRGRLVVWGGGHGDYRGNEVYTFDLQDLVWSRIWGPTPLEQIPEGDAFETYADGNPGSRHTYSGLSYLPPPHDAMIAMGGSLWQSGSFSTGTWRFSFSDGAWVRSVDGPAEQGFGDPSVHDPQTGHVFRRTNSRMVEYDPDADVYIDRAASNGGFWAPNVATALDPDRRLMIIVGEGRLDSYDLASDTYVQDVAIEGPGVSELFGDGGPGVGFDPVTAQFVLWAGGLDVFTYDPEARSFAQHTGAGDDPGTITASGGAFGRFRYAPSRNVFVWVDSVDANVFVFRMGEGQGMPPTGGGTSDGGGSGGATGSEGGVGETSAADGSGGVGDGPSDGSTTIPGGTDGGSSGAAAGDGGSGCGCASDRTRGAPMLVVGVLVLASRRRRGLHPRLQER